MPGRWRGATLASFGVVAALLVARTSRADVTKDACIDANAKAQDLRRDHKLSAAREQLTLCSDAACPALVRGDCARLLADLVQAQPSVVFDVATPSGAIVPGARVTVDGKRLPDGERSRALTLDPGPHSVTFEAAGFAPRTQTVVMLEGDKGHHEHIVLTPAATEAVPEAELQANADSGVGGPAAADWARRRGGGARGGRGRERVRGAHAVRDERAGERVQGGLFGERPCAGAGGPLLRHHRRCRVDRGLHRGGAARGGRGDDSTGRRVLLWRGRLRSPSASRRAWGRAGEPCSFAESSEAFAMTPTAHGLRPGAAGAKDSVVREMTFVAARWNAACVIARA